MTIESKFRGRCRKCGGSIAAGETVDWERGMGVAHLGECPAEQQAIEVVPLVPDGRYAVQLDGEWALFRIWRGTRNPSIQHVYSVAGVEKGDRIYGAREHAAAVAIATDPGKAAIEFGHRTGSCSKCGTELEVNLSRAMGVGPVCAKHWYENPDRLAMMGAWREALRAVGIDPQASDNADLSPARAWHDEKHRLEVAA